MKPTGLSRLVLWLALAGMILTVHLWIQQSRGFDQGCFGLSHPADRSNAGCQAVAALDSSRLFGVPNAVLGYGFYFAVALLAFGRLLVAPPTARRLRLLSEIAVALATFYSVDLVGQMALAHEYCALCLASAGLVLALAAAHFWLRLRSAAATATEPEPAARAAELAVGMGSLLAAAGLAVPLLLFVDRLGTRPLDRGDTARQLRQFLGDNLPTFIDGAKLEAMRACHFDFDAAPLDLAQFLRPGLPFVGSAAGVPVVIFYDPNCPHCKAYDATYRQLAHTYGDRARFYILPRILWDYSLDEVAALRLAEPTGKYFDLWERFFAAQQSGGLTIGEIAREMRNLGLDTAGLAQRLSALRPAVKAERDRAKAAGVDSVPTLYIAGRPVWVENETPACVGRLVDRVLARRPPG